MENNATLTTEFDTKHASGMLPVLVNSSSVQLNYSAVTSFRTRCSVIRDYPLYRIDIRNDLTLIFSEDSPCHVRLYGVSHANFY